MPIVYTPTVGKAAQNFSQVFNRSRGVWITPGLKGRIARALSNAAENRPIRLIVATDNESVLGIGDQGCGGMAISIGKLALYVAGAGIDPAQVLPVSLDVGTDNQALLDDELYLGWRRPRLRGAAYDELVQEFVEAVNEVFPGALIQWEDFRKDNALAILNRYREKVLSFNDDIQGTGAVALAGLMSAVRITGVPLSENRIVIYGAGAAGLGIARQLASAIREEGTGQGMQIAVLDSGGLLVEDRKFADEYKRELSWSTAQAAEFGLDNPQARGLAEVVKRFQPTILVGSSGQAGAFEEAIIRQMASRVARPIILPFSNPTDCSEATPENLLQWTRGQALVATGSPFPAVQLSGRTFPISQGNNVFIFPGLGMGALLAQATHVTDGMITAASQALAKSLQEAELKRGQLFPAIDRLKQVSKQVAIAVIKKARLEGVSQREREIDAATLLEESIWEANYPEYLPG